MAENQSSSSNHKKDGTSRELNLIRTTWSGWCGVVYIFLWIFLLRRDNGSPPYQKCIMFLLGLFLSMGICEAFLLTRSGHGLLAAPWQRFHLLRLFQKIVGWVVTYLIVCIPYWLFPEYHGSFYDPYYNALTRYAPLWILFFLCNVVVDDLKSESPTSDVYYLIGRAVVTFSLSDFRTPLSQHALKIHFLGWLVKLFFLPLMFIYLTNYMVNLQLDFSTTITTYQSLYTLTFFTDVGFATVGYAFGNKILDSHLRSTEPTVFGWVIALMCYQPFWSLLGSQYISYGSNWQVWLRSMNASVWFTMLWSTMILLCEALYVWATISFGTRFSNLTYRGIITAGPYYYVKHPAYIGKLCSFLLISIPFTVSVQDVLRWSLLIGVYYHRAKTEEAHLRAACVHGEYDVYEQELNARWRALWLWANPSNADHDITPSNSNDREAVNAPHEERDHHHPLLTDDDHDNKQQA